MSRRGAMTPARKRRIWLSRDGLCGDCGRPAPMLGRGVRYDHRIPLWISRSDADEGIWPLHTDCDAIKTPGDLRVIAKIKRIIRDNDPATRKPPRMRGRPFSKSSRPLTHPTLKRTVGGQVVPR